MIKKKTILAFVLAICLIVPAMFMMTACNKNKSGNGETAHTHTYSNEWKTNETHHWHIATCGHTEEKSDYAEHIFGVWTVTTEADYGIAGSKERVCSVCEYKAIETISALDAKPNTVTVEEIDFTYNGQSQAIDGKISALNETGMIVEYEGTNGTTYAKSTTAPTNAGSYKYTITIPATAEWEVATITNTFEIKKYAVTCPSQCVTKLPVGQTTTNQVCEIELNEELNGVDTLTLIYTGEAQKSGRMLVNTSNIQYDSNFDVVGLLSKKNIEWIVLDSNNEFGFKTTSPLTVGSYYQGTLMHGYVEVGSTMKIVGTNASGNIVMFDVTITKIEYQATYGTVEYGTFVETNIATYNNRNLGSNVLKITFSKSDTAMMSSYDYIISVKDIGKVNEHQNQTDNVSLIGSEYRAFKATIETTASIKLTVSNLDSCTVKVFNASTGAEITLESNTFNVSSGTEIIIVVKQDSTSATATHEIKLETFTLDV